MMIEVHGQFLSLSAWGEGPRVRCFGPRRTNPSGESSPARAIAPLSETHLSATCSFVAEIIGRPAKHLHHLRRRRSKSTPAFRHAPFFAAPVLGDLERGTACPRFAALRIPETPGQRPAPGVVARGVLSRRHEQTHSTQ